MLEWLEALYEAEPDQEWLRPQKIIEDDVEQQHWHDLYFRAFDALQYDRFFGAMGGEGPIYYVALSRYARDYGLVGAEFSNFMIFMNAVDGEWLKFRREQAASEEKRRKQAEAQR